VQILLRRGKAIIITYSECDCSLRYQAYNGHAPIFSYVAFPALPKFFYTNSKTKNISKKKLLNINVFIFYGNFV
jgi:hypothetical protein